MKGSKIKYDGSQSLRQHQQSHTISPPKNTKKFCVKEITNIWSVGGGFKNEVQREIPHKQYLFHVQFLLAIELNISR